MSSELAREVGTDVGVARVINPDVEPPPLNVDLMYYQTGGALIRGVLTDANKHTCMGWLRFPPKPRWLKDKLMANYSASVFTGD